MYFRAVAGLVAGLCAGVVTGIMFLVMSIPDTDGVIVPLLTVVSRAVGANDPAVGWSFHLFNSALMGIFYGLVFGRTSDNMGRSVTFGLLCGLVYWVLAGLFMLPTLINAPVLAPLTENALQPTMVGTLIGSIVFGVLMGVIYLLLYRPIDIEEHPRNGRAKLDRERDEELTSTRT